MSSPTFGIEIIRTQDEARPSPDVDLSSIGLVGPASGANATIFPLNQPVEVYTDDATKIAALGASGYLADAMRGIADQLGELQISARCCIVRTAEGTDPDPAIKLQQTIANVMGDATLGTGVHALLDAPEDLGFTPRLIATPGYTSQLANGVATLPISVQGSGYAPNSTFPLTFTGGGANAVQGSGTATSDATGKIVAAVVDVSGAWYTSPPTVVVPAPGTGGTQAVITATIQQLGNPVNAALPMVLNSLLAHAVVESAGVDEISDKAWRETIQSDRIIAMSGGVKVQDPITSNIVVRPVAPRVLGAIARVDHERGAPFHSAANQPLYGIVGAARPIKFAITTGGNEGQSLLEANVGIVVKGEVGDDFAIASGGFVLVATDTCSEDPLWQFYNVTRGRDYIHIKAIRTERYFLGRFNITPQSLQAVLNSVTFMLRDLKANDHILGYRVRFRGSKNSPEQIRLGHISVYFAAEEPTVLRKITNESARYRPAVEAMISQIESQLDIAG